MGFSGRHEAESPPSQAESAAPAVLTPCLIIIAGDPLGQLYQIKTDTVVVGRATDCDVCIVDDAVSRRHAQLRCVGHNAFEIEDLASTNGTFIDGQRVTTQKLNDGDKILVGTSTVLKFSLRDALEIKAQEQLFAMGVKDWLTQTFNKRYFEDHLATEWRLAARRNQSLSLIMVDLDHFKSINDTYGHLVGDRVLQGTCASIAGVLPKGHLLCRYGGEEFTVLVPDTGNADAAALAERCRAAVAQTVYDSEGTTFSVTASFGVSTAIGGASASPAALVAGADAALYEAKRRGRNRVEAANDNSKEIG